VCKKYYRFQNNGVNHVNGVTFPYHWFLLIGRIFTKRIAMIISDTTIKRFTDRAKEMSMTTDRYLNFLLDTRMSSLKCSGGTIQKISVYQLPYADGEVFSAKILQANSKVMKFEVEEPRAGLFHIDTPKALQSVKLERNQIVDFLYTEYLSNGKTYARLQLHRA
jgi:hypothetical protein